VTAAGICRRVSNGEVRTTGQSQALRGGQGSGQARISSGTSRRLSPVQIETEIKDWRPKGGLSEIGRRPYSEESEWLKRKSGRKRLGSENTSPTPGKTINKKKGEYKQERSG